MKILICVLAAGAAMAQVPASKGVNFYSVEREVELGKAEAARLEAEVSVVHDATVDSYLQSIGRSLRPADAAFEYRFVTYKGPKLENTGDIRVVPGGTMFIPLQSLADATTDVSVMTKVAHAIAHIEFRHATRMDTRRQIASYAQLPAVFMNGQTTLSREDIDELATHAMTKQFEKQAEQAAMVYLNGRQENEAGFEAARTAARAALE